MYDVNVLQDTTKGAYNEDAPIKNSQKTQEIWIEESRNPQAKNWISDKNYRPKSVGGLDSFYVNIGAIYIYIYNITTIAMQTATLPFIIITLAVYIS